MSAILHTNSLDLASLNLLQDYLTSREQRTKVESFYSTWEKLLSDAGSVGILYIERARPGPGPSEKADAGPLEKVDATPKFIA